MNRKTLFCIENEKDHFYNSLLCFIFAIAILCIFIISRLGFSQIYTLDGLRCLGYLAFVLFLPSFLRMSRANKGGGLSLFSESNSLIILTLLHLILFPIKEFLYGLVFIFAGPIIFLLILRNQQYRFPPKYFLLNSLIFTTLGVLVASFLFASAYHSSLLLERVPVQCFINSGSGVIDVYYHSAIANMITVYGKISTGLSGLPTQAYTTGSHLIFSGMCKVIGINSLTFYQIGYPLLVVPLFLKAILTFTHTLKVSRQVSFVEMINPFNMLILAVGFSYILPDKFGLPVGLWYSALNSESHCLGMAMFFLFLSSIAKPDYYKKPGFEEFLSLIPVMILIPVLVLTKLSTGVICILVAIYAYVRFRGYSQPAISAAFVLGLAGAVFAYRLVSTYVSTYEGAFNFVFLGFYKTWFKFPWVLGHLLTIYCWSAIVILVQIRQNKIRDLFELIHACKARKLVYSEILSILIVIGTVPCVLNIAGANAMYFLEMQYWLALAILVTLFTPQQILLPRRIVCATFIFLIFLLNLCFSIADLLREQRSVRNAIKNYRQSANESDRLLLSNSEHIVRKLRDIAKTPILERAKTAIFVSPKYKIYWQLFDNWQFLPNTIGFFGPGISGCAFVYGLPLGKVRMDLYGMRHYDFNWVKEKKYPSNQDAILLARKCNFKILLVWNGLEFEKIDLLQTNHIDFPPDLKNQ